MLVRPPLPSFDNVPYVLASALCAALFGGACSGTAFTSGQDSTAGAAAGQTGSGGSLGQGGQAGDPGFEAPGGTSGGDGDDAAGAAGAAAVNGEAGAAGAAPCAALSGHEYDGHCYVDASDNSLTQTEATAACAALADAAGRAGGLLQLESPEEQQFVLSQFMTGLADTTDAWLGLTCDDIEHPDFASCYCKSCSESELLAKKEAWTWPGGSLSTFGWVNANPNGDGRCSALTYVVAVMSWGWVDRVCSNASSNIGGTSPTHTYRTICELE